MEIDQRNMVIHYSVVIIKQLELKQFHCLNKDDESNFIQRQNNIVIDNSVVIIKQLELKHFHCLNKEN